MMNRDITVPTPGSVSGAGNIVRSDSSTFSSSGRGARGPVNDHGLFGAREGPHVGTGNMAEADKANVHYVLPIMPSQDEQYSGERVLRFVLDGPASVARPSQRGAVNSYTLGALNCLLEEHAAREQAHFADLLSGDPARVNMAKRRKPRYITTPEEFAARISFSGVQIPATEFSAPNWEVARRSGSISVPMKIAGQDPCALLWGKVKEGDRLDLMVHARPRPEHFGRREAYLDRAPLEVTPVVVTNKTTGVRPLRSLGLPLVNKSSGRDGGASRKRLKRPIEDQLDEARFVRENGGTEEVREMYRHLMMRDRTHRPAHTTLDAELLSRKTTLASVYGLDLCDRKMAPRVGPRAQTSMYLDTRYDGMVRLGDGNAPLQHAFSTVYRMAHFIHVGTVRYAPTSAYPRDDMIEKAVFDDPRNQGFQTLYENFKFDMSYAPA